jgi:hypothetical protein
MEIQELLKDVSLTGLLIFTTIMWKKEVESGKTDRKESEERKKVLVDKLFGAFEKSTHVIATFIEITKGKNG